MSLQYVSFFVGAGFPDSSLAALERHELDFIGADAGTIDVGPYQLAGQGAIFSEALCRHDLKRVLKVARQRRIPLLIGSCGGSGSDWGVDWFAGMVREIAAEEGLAPFKLARIYSEPDRDWLCAKLRDGRVRPLGHADLPYSEEVVRRSTRIVGVMGAEPFIAALDAGAEVVLAGRTTDSAIFSAIPLRRGLPHALAWHAGKVAECGGAIGEPARPDLLKVRLEGDGFEVTPLAGDSRCTPWSVAAHQLYENADPFRFVEPSGVLDASDARFEALDDLTVRITGARFTPAAAHTMKLEGVEPAGWQSIAMGAYNDPVLLEELPSWLERLRAEIDAKAARVFGQQAKQATVTIHTYGAGDGADLFGLTPAAPAAKDAFFLIDAVAPTQQQASATATLAWHTLIHLPPKGWSGSFVTAAWPFNPPVIDRGLQHRFNVDHVVELDDPLESLRFVYEDVR